jgi:ABC-2 type transport system ATP-binding protein
MIEVENLSKLYGSTFAIEDVTFSVAKGEILGFLGPNGAGKTTTMRILAGYLPATKGTAKIDGFEVHEDSMAVRQRIGYLPESPPLYPDMTVGGFLKFVAEIKQVDRSKLAERVTYAMERCNLLEKRKTLIRKLSKGFRQRVGIAQAIVHDPPVIILDEPTVGLDPKQIIDVRNLIKSLASDHTVILSTHILSEVSMTCDRIAIINNGKVVATGTPDSLMGQRSESSIYNIKVGGNFLQVQDCLGNVSGVSQVQIRQLDRPDLLQVRIQSNVDRDISRELSAALISQGLGLYELQRKQANLEETFLELTGKDAVVDAAPDVQTVPEITDGEET